MMPRAMEALRSARAWHVVTLLVGGGSIMLLQRGQWFFLDEWAFLKVGGPGYMEPHVGHWSLSAIALTQALRDTFGMESYLPYAAAVTVAHLALVHLVWRVMIRIRVQEWIATLAAAVLVVLGSGAENILWAFQVGFVGALAFALLALLMADAPHAGPWRLVGIIAATVTALTWSGTAIPLTVATAGLLWHRSGWKRAIVYACTTGGIYLTWYATYALGNPNNPDTGGLSLHKLGVRMPQFLGVMALLGWQHIFGLLGIGAIIAAAVLWWLWRVRRDGALLTSIAPALAMLAAAVLFALMAAYSRAEWSVGSGRSSRYVYLLAMLCFPVCAAALTRLVDTRPVRLGAAVTLLTALGAYQLHLLVDAAAAQSVIETQTHREMSAALALWQQDPGAVDLLASPDARWAPDVTLGDLVLLFMDKGLQPTDVGPDDLARQRNVVTADLSTRGIG